MGYVEGQARGSAKQSVGSNDHTSHSREQTIRIPVSKSVRYQRTTRCAAGVKQWAKLRLVHAFISAWRCARYRGEGGVAYTVSRGGGISVETWLWLVLYHEELKLVLDPGNHLVQGLVIWDLVFLLTSKRERERERQTENL